MLKELSKIELLMVVKSCAVSDTIPSI